MKPCVLIVDDSLTVRMDLSEAFANEGFATIGCATIGAAREACRQQAFDLAILDVLLPDGDGIALLAEMKATAATANKPVLLLSTEDEVRDRVRGLKTGADDYVGKPYDAGQVVSRARDLISQGRGRTRERPLVVVIDDSATFRAELRESLERTGYDVAVEVTGEEGLRLISNRRPDAVLVDQQLPGIDGPEIIRQLRADGVLRRTPCLLLTASENRTDEVRALAAGADGFAQKDSGPDIILAKLAALLRRSLATSAAPILSSLLAPKRILAVDDSETFLNELCDQLRGEGYDVVAAHSGAEALELLAMQPVDCILLDLVMPEMSGHETCRRIKAEQAWRDIPLIILTALDEAEAMIEGINAGADDYITKSGEFGILKARLHAQLRRKQFEDENREIREQLHRREMQAVETQALREANEHLEQRVKERTEEIRTLNASLEKRVRERTRQLEEANKELESFSFSVSHDLRAPLRAIHAFSNMLSRRVGHQLDDEARRYIKVVCESANRMGQLIEDLLSLARVSRQALRRERVDLAEEAKAIVANLRAISPEERTVEVEIADGLTAEGDRGLLRILLENLLNNAWKFTSKRECARIVFGRQAAEAGPPVFMIQDNGAGFDMNHAAKLFGAFQRLHDSEEFAGTGVGLATVARVVARHGGKVWAEAAVGKGATFYFTLSEG